MKVLEIAVLIAYLSQLWGQRGLCCHKCEKFVANVATVTFWLDSPALKTLTLRVQFCHFLAKNWNKAH
jgi:hypothetical protein